MRCLLPLVMKLCDKDEDVGMVLGASEQIILVIANNETRLWKVDSSGN